MEKFLKIFKALSDETRLKILKFLLNKERCVCEIVKHVKRTQPTVSLQLSKLQRLGIVKSRREGKKVYYSITNPKVKELLIKEILIKKKIKRKEKLSIGLIVCNSCASNSGTLTGLAAIEAIKKFDDVGIFSLPALVNKVTRQTLLVQNIKHKIVIDGCHNECSKKIVKRLKIDYDAYVNLEYDLGIKKLGPFTTLNYSSKDVDKVSTLLIKKIKEIRGRSEHLK